MNSIDYQKPSVASSQDSTILKFSLIGCSVLGLIGWLVFVLSGLQYVSNGETKTELNTGEIKQELVKPEQSIEFPVIVVKKSGKPVIVEEGSDAYDCIQNNGGTGCLNRDRFAPDYQVVSSDKTYEDQLVEYGIRPINKINNCPPEIAWQPNCQY